MRIRGLLDRLEDILPTVFAVKQIVRLADNQLCQIDRSDPAQLRLDVEQSVLLARDQALGGRPLQLMDRVAVKCCFS